MVTRVPVLEIFMGRSREETGRWTYPGQSQKAICFLRKSGTNPTLEAIGPLGPIASIGRWVRPTVKFNNWPRGYKTRVYSQTQNKAQ